MLPDPVYLARSGQGNTGRVRTTAPPAPVWAATIRSGALPRSTQSTSRRMRSDGFGLGPPPAQWNMSGNMNSRANRWVARRPPIRSWTAW